MSSDIFFAFESISDILVPKRKKFMLSDYINLAQNIRNSYLVRILSSKREEFDLINYEYASALTKKYGFNEKVDMIRFFTINFDEEKRV